MAKRNTIAKQYFDEYPGVPRHVEDQNNWLGKVVCGEHVLFTRVDFSPVGDGHFRSATPVRRTTYFSMLYDDLSGLTVDICDNTVLALTVLGRGAVEDLRLAFAKGKEAKA